MRIIEHARIALQLPTIEAFDRLHPAAHPGDRSVVGRRQPGCTNADHAGAWVQCSDYLADHMQKLVALVDTGLKSLVEQFTIVRHQHGLNPRAADIDSDIL